MNILDRGINFVLDRYYNAVGYSEKYRTPRRVPSYIAAEADRFGLSIESLLADYSNEQLQRIAASLSWIYSNIDTIAKEASAAKLNVVKRGTNELDTDHEFEQVLDRPNEFFSRTALIQYIVWAMHLDENGAYCWIVPKNYDNLSEGVAEVWPIPVNKVTPVRHPTKFISHYEYRTNGMEKPLRLDARFVVRFFFPDPFDLYKNLTPLEAARRSINIYQGIASSQSSLFNEGGGIPLSVVVLDKDIQDSDFAVVRARLKEDWAEKRRIAITRSGTIDVKTIGISNKDLEVVASQQLNRDEIDSIFMGFPWRSEALAGGESLREVNRQIKEKVIRPLHELISGQIQVTVINAFYGPEYKCNFDDVRNTDKALRIQEWNIAWRGKTFNEVRRDLGLPPYELSELPKLGELPFALSANAAFVANYYNIGPQRDPAQKPLGVGNISESRAPLAITNAMAREDERPETGQGIEDVADAKSLAANEGIRTEIKRYRTVVTRAFKREGESPSAVDFFTSIIPDEVMEDIKSKLTTAVDETQIKEAFSEYLG